MASVKERIAEYLASGLNAAQVASMVGHTPAYIAQLKKEESFQLILAEKQKIAQEEEKEDVLLENRYQSLEHAALDRAHQAIAFAELPAITSLLKVVSERQDRKKQRAIAPALAHNTNQVIVNVSIPAHALPEVSLNSQKEVTAIGGKELAPMSASGVRNLFAQMAGKAQALPSTAEVIENDPIPVSASS